VLLLRVDSGVVGKFLIMSGVSFSFVVGVCMKNCYQLVLLLRESGTICNFLVRE
jgi:hypothetical protein